MHSQHSPPIPDSRYILPEELPSGHFLRIVGEEFREPIADLLLRTPYASDRAPVLSLRAQAAPPPSPPQVVPARRSIYRKEESSNSALFGMSAPVMFAVVRCSFVLVSLFYLKGCAQNFGQTRFICTSVPVDMDMCTSSMQSSGSTEDMKTTVLQLRETVLQQKETIMNQKETIRELTTKLGRCESQSTVEAGPGESKTGGGSGRKQTGSSKNTMGDLSRIPAAETLSQLGQTLQSLKTRLENLEQFSRMNSSSQTNSLKDILQNNIDDLEKQVLSRINSLEEGKYNSKNESEERGKIESTLTSLHQRISDLEKVPGQANELVLIEWGNNPMEILINDKVAKLPFVINDGKWHHICIAWTTRDGVWEAYQDGTQRGNGENLAPYHPIKPQGVLVLGQEQDTLGGGFDATQAFVGELAHFNIWDRKLTPGEVYNLATCSTKALPGSVIAWSETNIDIYGGATKWTFEACRQIN
ncbi:neuronal pentraxin-1 [Crotalus adamanteus]|uniref:Neuronal pentraxin-1 n=1 Tax=Crotalus adamanteus TaxID=8729 RepID=A0AAW1BYT7_CROAD